MCWITLTPAKRKHHHHDHHPHLHHTHSDHGSSVEELVRIRHDVSSSRLKRVKIVAPTLSVVERDHHHHHRLGHHTHHHHHHPHIHPLHLHPLHHHHHPFRLSGPGKKRCPPPPPPPPPSRSPSSCPSPRQREREPIYRTQIVEPRTQEVRETTRIALREVRPERGRLRRVAGYEVLGREVPWSWDCVSSVAESGTTRRGKDGGRGYKTELRFPPFGGSGSWM